MIEGLNPNQLVPVNGTVPKAAGARKTAGEMSFNAVLEANLQKDAGLKFSAHAQERLASRQIALSTQDLQRIEGGVDKAAAKGARESLVVKDDTAFVVSITNRTVITAVDANSMRGNVFTNIDSAVIV